MTSSKITPKKVAVVIPCYNEAAGIADVILKFERRQLAHVGIDLQIFVVDNNSTDNTSVIAKKCGANVLHERQQGKGNALRTGFNNLPADIDYVVMLDGDDTYSPTEVLRIIEPLRSDFCDVVLGSRLGGKIKPAAMSRLNLLGNRIFTSLARRLYGANISDVLTGYFAWKKPALDALKPHIKSHGFAIEMEMVTKMARLGLSMVSVPISYEPRTGQANLHPFKDGVRILAMLLKNLVWRPPRPQSPKAKPQMQNSFVPRTIVFVSDAIYPYLKGGKEKRLHEITKHLAAMGHNVHIYTMHWWDEPATHRLESGVHLHAICKYHEMYKNDRRTIKEALLFALACLKLFRVHFDVLDVDHMPFFPIFSAWLVCALRGRKLHATWHEALSHQEWISYMGPSGIIASIIEHMSIKLPHHITAASAHTQQQLANLHGRVERVGLVSSGLDTSLMDKVTSASVSCDVLFVGRLVKDKNIDKLILAIDKLAETNPKISCVIIGQGIEKPHLQKLVAQHRLQKNVTFLDPLPNAADVYGYMKAAKVFCSPSVREGFGIVSLEALGCGTPVITVDSPGNAARHLVQDGQNGSIVPLSPDAIAEAIHTWISMAEKPSIATQIAEYDWRHLAKKQAEAYML